MGLSMGFLSELRKRAVIGSSGSFVQIGRIRTPGPFTSVIT
jgi:hypothetical protein